MASTGRRERDPFGFDDNRNLLAEAVGKLVPGWVARRAVTIGVEPETTVATIGDELRFTVTIRNRLPVPVTIRTPSPRLWGWAIDDEVEATNERSYPGDTGGELSLDAREVRRIDHVWSGRFERVGAGPNDQSAWVVPDPGRHELSVFIASLEPRATDHVTIEFRDPDEPS